MAAGASFAGGLFVLALSVSGLVGAASPVSVADPMVAIDMHRTAIIADIVEVFAGKAGDGGAGAAVLAESLRKLRADRLLAASLASSRSTLDAIIAEGASSSPPALAPTRKQVLAVGGKQALAIGDPNRDLVYTPLTPCRLIDTRGSGAPIQGGPFAPGERRSYVPNGLCSIPTSGVATLLVSFTTQNLTPNSGGVLAILAPNAPFSVTNDVFNTGSVWSASNTAVATGSAGQFDVFVVGANAQVIIDILGYFAPPAGGGGGGAIGGSGTVNSLPKWTPNGTTLGDSALYENNALVGIGTTSPAYTLDIVGPNAQLNLRNGVSGATALLSRYTNRFEISPSDAFQVSVGGIAVPHFWIGANGNVGVGNTAPANKLQVGATPSFSGNDFAIGNGTKAMSFFQTNTASTWFSSANFSLMPNTGNGFVGIGTQAPASRLQIGSVGSTGFNGHDIAFGNGTQASGIAQTGSIAQWYSTTDIALMPQGNGRGRVGINTKTPAAPLEVDDYVVVAPGVIAPGGGFGNYSLLGLTGFKVDTLLTSVCKGCAGNVSILAANNVMALEFDAASDARIKDVGGISDSARDLATVDALEVTDYTLKDKIRHGNQPFKKVIAQQVETVYPQVVSKHVEFIPNVYRAASSVAKTARGYRLHFDTAHGLSGQAKRLKLFASGDNTMQKVGIVAIPSANDVEIDLAHLNGDRVFVYGEEVDDFRTVDYEGLTALNISATQELSKRLARQQADMAALATRKDAELANLRQQVAAQTARIAVLEQQALDVAMLKQQMAQMVRLQAQAGMFALAARK